MQILAEKLESKFKSALSHPYVVLRSNTWDDFGYKTLFDVILVRGTADRITLGSVKIIRDRQAATATIMPQSAAVTLAPDFCSLGTDIEYYEAVAAQGRSFYETFLPAMQDAATQTEVRARFEGQEAFKVSLTRFSNAVRALSDARKLFEETAAEETGGDRNDEAVTFTFQTVLAEGTPPVMADFDFVPRGELPHRVNVLIGYNGSGKTRLLSNLAIATHGYGYASKEDLLLRRAGSFVGAVPALPTVVTVSFSAFDDFVLPGVAAPEREELKKENSIFGYSYIGLRERLEAADGGEGDPAAYRLRSPAETVEAFKAAFGKVISQRSTDLEAILKPLASEASFRRVGLDRLLAASATDSDVEDTFRRLSSGHKIVLIMLVELTFRMDGVKPTLVLIDEPETHLHPPLLAALLKCIKVCLGRLNGYAVIATHSPVVLQETPSRYVRVLTRDAIRAPVRQPAMETFGESIGVITQEIFNLDDQTTDWHDTLRALAKGKTSEELEDLFGRRLGFEALSYLASFGDDQES